MGTNERPGPFLCDRIKAENRAGEMRDSDPDYVHVRKSVREERIDQSQIANSCQFRIATDQAGIE